MIGKGLTGIRIGYWAVMCLALCAGSAANAEPAATNNCPGHPDAIGTARTLVVDPRAHPRIGSMQYPETLPLADHEVVLTFDDGPLPRYSNQVLQILADNCVKATFFTIGEQARANPEGVRKLIAAGHSVGTHSQRHPLNFHKMTEAQARQEIEQGIDVDQGGDDRPERARAVLPHTGPASRPTGRGLSGVPGHPDLEHGFSRRRLAPHFGDKGP